MGTLVIIGGTGELGRKAVLAACADGPSAWPGSLVATYNNSPPPFTSPKVNWVHLDCADHKAVRSFILSQAHLAAVVYCAVPKHGGAAGKGGSLVRAGIVDDVVNCAEAVTIVAAKFIAISTDLVFDGNIPPSDSYSETSLTCPPNPYGQYKEQMERQLLTLSGKIIIARTSLILTMDEPHFGKAIQFVVDCINGKHGEIELFTDELRNMSFSDDLGRALVELAKPHCTHVGLIHMVSDEVTNRWELAKLLAKRLKLEHNLGKWAKSGISAKSGLNRPLNCSLCTELKNKVLKTHIDGISERLA